ncbi:MAG: hypothetical protein DRP67_00570 [Candidatus Omnitrophota bacterium]|nr:MAG: hypothetical protein DRP67_00570 [Candidatus Omnitrophota bacterium]
MGKNFKVILSKSCIIILTILFITGCYKKEENIEESGEKISSFSIQSLGEKVKFSLVGESAEVKEKKGEIKKPEISLEFENQIIEIKTGPEGKAEIKISSENQKVEKAVLTGNIKITQKNIKTKEITLEAYCKKLTYIEKDGVLIMEGKPVLKRGKSKFCGEKIFYYWKGNKLEIKGEVNVLIYPEKSSGD